MVPAHALALLGAAMPAVGVIMPDIFAAEGADFVHEYGCVDAHISALSSQTLFGQRLALDPRVGRSGRVL